MDASLISSLYLVPEWISRMIEDYNNEVEETSPYTLKLLEDEGRQAVWNLCEVLGVETNGVPAQACRLLERYLFKHLHKYTRLGLSSEEWDQFKRSMSEQLPLLMTSCVQLAAKINSSCVQVSATLVRTCLLCKGIDFSIADILRSEFHVFSTLGFRVPLWTSLEYAQMLALEGGMSTSDMTAVSLVVNIAEYRRHRITKSVKAIANMSPSTTFNTGSLGTLHLAAGAVVATARYLAITAPHLLPRVASLTRAPPCYIKCVSGIILTDLLRNEVDDNDRTHHNRKRKRSH